MPVGHTCLDCWSRANWKKTTRETDCPLYPPKRCKADAVTCRVVADAHYRVDADARYRSLPQA
jgi:hypothetical protein